jgi:N-acetylglucosaminyldiphosphoundecaprenol N-acetyl-beta-D-mannosaminyltransferase
MMTPDQITALPTAHRIGGVQIHPLRLAELLGWIEQAIRAQQRTIVAYANIHAINLAQRHTPFREALNSADVVFCDGQGLRLGAALLGYQLPERFTPPDWINALAETCAANRDRVFLLGGRPGVAEEAARRLRDRHPGLEIATHDGYFLGSPEREQAVLDAIRAFQPTLLLVGMGMPIQECWVTAQRDQIDAPVVMTVGALFDYLAGAVARGPRWLTDNGFEWLCRLWYEPRRLWKRYLLGNPLFLLLIGRQWVAERHRRVAERHRRASARRGRIGR